MSSLKSVRSDEVSCVKFVNKSPRRVDIFWVNFQGKLVRYAKSLPPNSMMEINTYVTHPWIARDADSSDVLLLNKSRVYMPVAWDREAPRTEVQAHLPVYSLQERAMQVLRKIYSPQEISDLEIARILKQGLMANRKVESTDYQIQSRRH